MRTKINRAIETTGKIEISGEDLCQMLSEKLNRAIAWDDLDWNVIAGDMVSENNPLIITQVSMEHEQE